MPWFLRPGPVKPIEELSLPAQALVAESFGDLDPESAWDVHVHLVGLGQGDSGCWIQPQMRSHAHPIRRIQYEAYMAAAGVRGEEDADRQYLQRLLALHRAANPEGKLLLFGFDYHVDSAGREVPERSPFYTPNDYVLRVAAENPDVRACASVHPYRTDAVERLSRCAAAGAIAVKWLPNAMGIDPASERCDAFYGRMAELKLPLITHAGLEKAVHAEGAQELGNPLRLRRALDQGVKVVVAHCASLGESLDLDGGGAEREKAESFELFLRMMDEERYEGLLFGEISALTQINRCGEPLRQLLRRNDLHPRLVNGSDYPLPAIDPLFSTRLLVRRGYLEPSERAPLNEIFEANALLFDFVLKRRLRLVEGAVHRFPPGVFESRRLFA